MRNRARCKKCSSIIESYHGYDYVSCKCGEIAVSDGEGLKCYANDFSNFIRVDDEGNEIIVSVQSKSESISQESQSEAKLKQTHTDSSKPSKKDLSKMLEEMIKSYENLPQNAMYSPITHYDLYSALLLVAALFRAED